QQVVACRVGGAICEGVRLADPAVGQRVDVDLANARVFAGEPGNDDGGGVGAAVVDHDDFPQWIVLLAQAMRQTSMLSASLWAAMRTVSVGSAGCGRRLGSAGRSMWPVCARESSSAPQNQRAAIVR